MFSFKLHSIQSYPFVFSLLFSQIKTIYDFIFLLPYMRTRSFQKLPLV